MTLPTGILLAAGNSRRFGSQKLLYRLPGGEPLGVVSARNLVAVLPDSIAVVRRGDTELRASYEALGFRIVENPDPESGMGDSLALAVEATRDAAGWLVALADMPWISPATVRRVALAIEAGASMAAPVYDGSRGHPVGFSRQWAAKLAGLSGDAGARGLLAAHPGLLRPIAVDEPGILRDVDLPEDLEQA